MKIIKKTKNFKLFFFKKKFISLKNFIANRLQAVSKIFKKKNITQTIQVIIIFFFKKNFLKKLLSLKNFFYNLSLIKYSFYSLKKKSLKFQYVLYKKKKDSQKNNKENIDEKNLRL